jgi:hypothetical protein
MKHDYWQRYVRDLADRMRLRDWHITVTTDPPDKENAAAQVVCTYGRKIAELRLSKEWAGYTPTEQRHYMTHELVHCHLDVPWAMVIDDMKGVIGNQAHEVLVWPFARAMEYAVDGLAEVIAPSMPLPEQEAA